MPRKYRKKPVEVEAVQWTGQNRREILDFCGEAARVTSQRDGTHAPHRFEIEIVTLEDGHDGRAKHVASRYDFIVKGVSGEFYPVKPDIFWETYEPAFVSEASADRLQREVDRRDAVLDWIEENVPSALELCPFKLVRQA